MNTKWVYEQQRKYRAQVAELGLTEEQRRALLHQLTGKDSTTQLDKDEMSAVINAQEQLIAQAKGLAPGERHMSQGDFVHVLERRLGWHRNPRRLAGFIRRQTHGLKESVVQLSAPEKTIIIEALKAMLYRARRRPDASGTDEQAITQESTCGTRASAIRG